MGSGFSNDPEKLSVDIDGVKCQIISCTTTEIRCKIQARNSAPSQKLDVGILYYQRDLVIEEDEDILRNDTVGNDTVENNTIK